jgi:hypothetical protein
MTRDETPAQEARPPAVTIIPPPDNGVVQGDAPGLGDAAGPPATGPTIEPARDPGPVLPPETPDAAPQGEGGGGVGSPPPSDPALGDPDPTLRQMRGPRGSVAAMADSVQEVGGLRELFRRIGSITPNTAPRVRPQNFVDIEGRQILVREATEQEAQDIATAIGTPAADVRMISTRGAYMPTDVQEFMAAVRAANSSLFEELRRGTQTREQQIAAAERLGLDGAVDRLLRRQAGEAFNNEELIAGAIALINIKRELDEAAAELLRVGTNSGPEAERRFGLNMALAAAVAGQLNGAAAEAGRALGALRFVQDALSSMPPEQLGEMARRLGVNGQAGPAGLRVPSTATDEAVVDMLGGSDAIRTAAHLWAALPTPAARLRFAQRSMGQRVMDAFISAYVNSLLWLPTTHIRGILGNTTMGLWQVPERFLAGAIGEARTALHIGRDERVEMAEGLAMLTGIYRGFGEGLRVAGEVWRTNVPATMYNRLETVQVNAISAEAFQIAGPMGRAVDWAGTVLTLPGRALITADAVFTTTGQRMELHAQALRTRNALVREGMAMPDAIDEAARLLADPPEMWREAAERTARSMTFQDEMTGILAQLDRVMQHPVAKIYVAFFRTPTNIVRAVLDRTPFSLAIPGRVWADIRAGGAQADMALSRLTLGTALMWWMSTAVMESAGEDSNVRITGSAPNEPARRQAFQRQGLQPYSICSRTNDEWTCRSYMNFDPVSGLLAMAADTANYVLDNPDNEEGIAANLEALAAGGAFGLYEYMLEMPMLQGVAEIARVIGQPQQANSERAAATLQALVAQVGNAVMSPVTLGTLSAGVERAIDPTASSTLPPSPEIAQSSAITRGFYQALQRAQARVPGASDNVEPLLNIWGEPVRPTSGGLWELFWPIRTTTGTSDRLEETLYRLGGVLRLPERSFPGTNVRLDATQYNALIRRMNEADGSGQTMREEMAATVERPDFITMDPADQIARLRRIYMQRWQAAQTAVTADDPALDERVRRDREYRDVMGRPPRAGADIGQMR